MSGAIASVILRSPFTAADTGLVAQLLRDRFNDVAETGKGRHWDFTDSGSRASLTVLETSDRPDLCDALVGAGLSPADSPEIVVIAYPSKLDRDSCARLAAIVAELLAGLNRGVGDG